MKTQTKFMIFALLGFALLGAAPTASAQNDPKDQLIPSIELQDSPIRDALRILFKNVGVSYSIAQDVQGTVTASLKNVPFETVLRNLLGQVDATYRVEGAIYVIVKKEIDANPGGGTTQPADPLPTTGDQKNFYRLKINRADPQYIYLLLRGEMGFNSGPELSTMSGGGFGRGMGGMGGGQGGFGGGGFGGGGGMGGMGGGMGGMGGGMGGGGFGGGGGMGGGGGFGGGGRGGGGGRMGGR